MNQKVIGSGKWIRLVELNYSSQEGKSLKWEMVERTTKTSSGVDGILFILKKFMVLTL